MVAEHCEDNAITQKRDKIEQLIRTTQTPEDPKIESVTQTEEMSRSRFVQIFEHTEIKS